MKTYLWLIVLQMFLIFQPGIAAADGLPDTIPQGIFAHAASLDYLPSGKINEVIDTLASGADVLVAYEDLRWKAFRHHPSHARRIVSSVVGIGVDTTVRLAWVQRHVIKATCRKWRRSDRVYRHKEWLTKRKQLSYSKTMSMLSYLDSIGFHRLDPKQLTAMIGPVQADGSQARYSISDIGYQWVLLVANGRYHNVTTKAPRLMYDYHPELYDDRKIWLEGYAAIRSLITP